MGQALISCVQIIMNTFDYLCHFHFIIIDTKSFVLEMHVSVLILYRREFTATETFNSVRHQKTNLNRNVNGIARSRHNLVRSEARSSWR